MFSFSLPAFPPGATPTGRRLFWGGLCVGGALIALWLVMSFLPDASVLGSSGADAEAADEGDSVAGGGVTVFTPGRILVLVLLAAGGACAIYLQQQTSRGNASASPLQPLGQLSVGPNQHLHLVRCHDEVLLIGATDAEITLLRTYSEDAFAASLTSNPDAQDAPPLPQATSSSSLSGFAHVLRQYAQRRPNA